MSARFFDKIIIRAHSDSAPSGATVTAFESDFSSDVDIAKLEEKAKLDINPEAQDNLGDGTVETTSEKSEIDFVAVMSYSAYTSLQTAIYGSLVDVAYIDTADENLNNGGIPYLSGVRLAAEPSLEGGSRLKVHITGGKISSEATDHWSLISS